MIVKALNPNGAIKKDGRLNLGDYLTAINNENLRNVTNSQARAILRRAQLLSTDITYEIHYDYLEQLNLIMFCFFQVKICALKRC